MIDPGRYYGPINGIGLAKAKKGTLYFWIEVEVQYRQDGEASVECEPQTATIALYLSEKAYAISGQQLERLGFNGDWQSPALSAESMAGVWIDCVCETYDGKSRAKCSLASDRPQGWKHEPIDADSIGRLNAMWKAKHAPANPNRPAPRKPNPPSLAAEKNTADDWP